MRSPRAPRRVLAVASGGGHWVQLLRLRPAFEGCEVVYVTTNGDYASQTGLPVRTVTDANAREKGRLILMGLQMACIVARVRPDAVVTTGAAPGLAAVFFGRLFGARTLWLDSIANAEELSASGKLARRFAHAWLTQWESLAGTDGPAYWGRVL